MLIFVFYSIFKGKFHYKRGLKILMAAVISVPPTVCLFVCLFQWTPSFKEGGEYPLGWDLAHVLRPNRPHYHPEVGA